MYYLCRMTNEMFSPLLLSFTNITRNRMTEFSWNFHYVGHGIWNNPEHIFDLLDHHLDAWSFLYFPGNSSPLTMLREKKKRTNEFS